MTCLGVCVSTTISLRRSPFLPAKLPLPPRAPDLMLKRLAAQANPFIVGPLIFRDFLDWWLDSPYSCCSRNLLPADVDLYNALLCLYLATGQCSLFGVLHCGPYFLFLRDGSTSQFDMAFSRLLLVPPPCLSRVQNRHLL